MNPKVKKVLLWLLIAFIVYAIFASPNQAADIVVTMWNIIVTAFNSLATFFQAILNRT